MKILVKRSGIIHPSHNGTYQSLLDDARRCGVDCSVALSIATNPRQQKNVNDFAISLKEVDGIIPFGSVHPDSPDALNELERIKSSGLKGVKLHPDYQGFFIDEEKMIPIYEKIGSLGLITVLHCGYDIGYPRPVHCTPEKLATVLPAFGGAPVVAAHLGGLYAWDETEKHLCGKDIYLDTAYCGGILSPAIGKELFALHGADKILFASDAPWNSPEIDLGLIDCLDLSESDKKAILGGNAQRLLGL